MRTLGRVILWTLYLTFFVVGPAAAAIAQSA